jgi:hypothetical protein
MLQYIMTPEHVPAAAGGLGDGAEQEKRRPEPAFHGSGAASRTTHQEDWDAGAPERLVFRPLSAQGRNFDDVFGGRMTSSPPGRPEDTAPAGEPVPGTEAAALGRPTRGKGEPASTRRKASERRSGGPASVTVFAFSST